MAKPEITASDAELANEAPPPAPAPVKANAGPEVATPQVAAPNKPKSEKALRMAQAMRATMTRRKITTGPARQSN